MWEFNNTDELYHFGIPGMKWGVRRRLYNGYQTKLDIDRRKLSSMEKNLAWMKKNHASIANSKSKSALDRIGKSKLLTKFRERKMVKTKNKINTYKQSIKEDNEIVKNLKQKLDQHKKAEMAKTKMKIAKADARAGARQSGHDRLQSQKLLATSAHEQAANNSYKRAVKLGNDYYKAKQEYKRLKKGL